MNYPFQPFLDQLAQDLQGILPPEEIQATVADARAHLHDLQSRLLAEGMPPDLAAQQALLEFGETKDISRDLKLSPWAWQTTIEERTTLGLAGAFLVLLYLNLGPFLRATVSPNEDINPTRLYLLALALAFSVAAASVRGKRILASYGLVIYACQVMLCFGIVLSTSYHSPSLLTYMPVFTLWFGVLIAMPHFIGLTIGHLFRKLRSNNNSRRGTTA